MIDSGDALAPVMPNEDVLACAILTRDSVHEMSESGYLLAAVNRSLEEARSDARTLFEALLVQIAARVESLRQLDQLDPLDDDQKGRLASTLTGLPTALPEGTTETAIGVG